jgi:geranylgeranyl diphosphate synthase type I
MVIAFQTAEAEAAIETELHKIFQSRDLALYDMMSYHMGWESGSIEFSDPIPGSRIHGVACLTACAAAGGDILACLPAAAAVELVHGFTQIHDDVQSGNPQRVNRDAVWWKWGPAQAINAGDGMHALARIALFRLNDLGVAPATTFRAVQILDQASLTLCEGRFRDLEIQERIDLSVDAYIEMASDKTGALYAGAMKLGALVAGADEELVASFGQFGSKIGLARQIQDDLNELWGDQEASPEVLNKKKLLPVVYTVQEADISVKRRMGDIYFKRVLEPSDVASLRVLLEETGGKKFAEDTVENLRVDALASLDQMQLVRASRDMLQDLASAILSK